MRNLLLCLLFVSVSATAHAQFRDESAGLVLAPPDFLVRQSQDQLAADDLLACWYAPASGEYPWMRMCVERVDHLPNMDERLRFQWQGSDLNGSRSSRREGDEDVMQYSALLPLRLGTVRLDVIAPVRGATEARRVLEETLATARDVGPATAAGSNDGRASAVERIKSVGLFLVVMGVCVWFGGRQRRRRRKLRRQLIDTVLGR